MDAPSMIDDLREAQSYIAMARIFLYHPSRPTDTMSVKVLRNHSGILPRLASKDTSVTNGIAFASVAKPEIRATWCLPIMSVYSMA